MTLMLIVRSHIAGSNGRTINKILVAIINICTVLKR